jgi:acetyl-CoA carboxylase biotin carboxyl carrier protein
LLKIGEIRELIRLLDETSVAELKIEHDDMKLFLKKADTNVVVAAPAVAPAVMTPPVQQIHTAVQTQAEVTPSVTQTAVSEAVPVEDDKSIHLIKSPMVGTFYCAPSPDAPPFVTPGVKVGPKSIVCIVEAMKLMNEIEAEVSGDVVDVLVENGQLVEYGQPLFKIRLG